MKLMTQSGLRRTRFDEYRVARTDIRMMVQLARQREHERRAKATAEHVARHIASIEAQHHTHREIH